MNSKGQTYIWVIGGVLVFMVISLVIVLLIIGTDRMSNPDEVSEGEMQIFLGGHESGTHPFYKGEYVLSNNTIFYEGKLTDSLTSTIIRRMKNITMYCWGDNLYTGKTFKKFTEEELSQNKSKIECNSDKIGKLEIIRTSGDLSEENNLIKLNVTARDGSVNKIGMCFTWTAGIINTYLNKNFLLCSSEWKNTSNGYSCNGVFEQCGEINGNKCTLKEIEIPRRFELKVDSCENTGESLKEGQSIEIGIRVKTTDFKNSLDKLEIIFFDNDLRPIGNSMQYVSELNKVNIGTEDTKYTIDYVN
tara:strand:+ start:6262 stop:7170 length:909 start_codon:yes stop_codon:yes gene_type:complete